MPSSVSTASVQRVSPTVTLRVTQPCFSIRLIACDSRESDPPATSARLLSRMARASGRASATRIEYSKKLIPESRLSWVSMAGGSVISMATIEAHELSWSVESQGTSSSGDGAGLLITRRLPAHLNIQPGRGRLTLNIQHRLQGVTVMTVLRIDASIQGPNSASSELADLA